MVTVALSAWEVCGAADLPPADSLAWGFPTHCPRMTAATRDCSSRRARSGHAMALGVCGAAQTALGHYLADLQHAAASERMSCDDVDRLRYVLALQQVEPQQDALGLQERTVGDLALPVPYPDRNRIRIGCEFATKVSGEVWRTAGHHGRCRIWS